MREGRAPARLIDHRLPQPGRVTGHFPKHLQVQNGNPPMNSRELGNTLVNNATYVDQSKYHAIFSDLRRNAPFALAEPDGYRPFRVVSKYEDIKTVESQPAIFLNQPRTFLATIEEEGNLALAQAAGLTAMGRSLVNIDGDDHRLVAGRRRAFGQTAAQLAVAPGIELEEFRSG